MKRRLLTMVGVAAFVFASIPMALAGGTFTDVQVSDWFYDDVETIYASGITKGYPDGSFKPYRNVTRAEMATFSTRIGGAAAQDWNALGGTYANGWYHLATVTIDVPGVEAASSTQYVMLSGTISAELTGSHSSHTSGLDGIDVTVEIKDGADTLISPARKVSLWDTEDKKSVNAQVLVPAQSGATTYKLYVNVANISGDPGNPIILKDAQLIATTFAFDGDAS